MPVEPLVGEPAPHPLTWRDRGLAFLLAILLASLYEANGREIAQYDTESTTLTAFSLVRGGGIFLDQFRLSLRETNGRLPAIVKRTRGHILSRYPLGPAVIALPLEWPQAALFDRFQPGWDRQYVTAIVRAKFFAKNAATCFMATTGALLHLLLVRMGLRRVAVPAVLAAMLGSNLWTVGSQALWQHGPAALALTTVAFLLATPRPTRLQFLGAGFAAAWLVAFRAIDIVFALAVLGWVVVRHPRRVGWFLPGPLAIGLLLLCYNMYYFGNPAGGQSELEALHPAIHGVKGPWDGNLVEGAVGTTFSPSRGLFVYCPWTLLALALAPFGWSRLRPFPVVRVLLVAIVPFFAMLSKYAVWWAGHSFGPRYWTDVMPVFGILFAAGLDAVWSRSRGVVALAAALVLYSIGLQIIGAWCFPSSWNHTPKNVDTHHERLWDWRDNEITRSLREWRMRQTR